MISVPLTAGEDVTGVIQVGVPPPRVFDDDNLLLLGLAADRVALAIDHALVFEREHRIAETLQRSLLPERLPALPGLEVAARYIPAASEAEVGGDWYDVIPIDSSRVGLVMGDVAGKGLAAASMVGRLRSRHARLRARGPRARRRGRQPEPAGVVRGRGHRDGHAGVRGGRPGGQHPDLGQRRAPAAAGAGRRRVHIVPGGTAVGAARA